MGRRGEGEGEVVLWGGEGGVKDLGDWRSEREVPGK